MGRADGGGVGVVGGVLLIVDAAAGHDGVPGPEGGPEGGRVRAKLLPKEEKTKRNKRLSTISRMTDIRNYIGKHSRERG